MFAKYRIKEYTNPNTNNKYYMLESKFWWDIFGITWTSESFLQYRNKAELENLIQERENYKSPTVIIVDWYDRQK
jgi:hypothetical protein